MRRWRRFEIRDRGDDRAAQLSKGLKQRVALARSLLHDPRITMLDEPTSGLDPESARDVRDLILALREQGRTVLLCTHNLDEVERVADRVAVLNQRLVAIGTPSSLRQRLFTSRLRHRARAAGGAVCARPCSAPDSPTSRPTGRRCELRHGRRRSRRPSSCGGWLSGSAASNR
jgi:ABC-2 type transport system ATP-binding protein